MDEVAATGARTATAPNAQDLQSSIAPQLTTAGSDPETQPEISAEELRPCQNLPFIQNWPLGDPISELVDHDPAVANLIHIDLERFRKIVNAFILTQDQSWASLESYKTKLKFKQNTKWIGHLLVPQ